MQTGSYSCLHFYYCVYRLPYDILAFVTLNCFSVFSATPLDANDRSKNVAWCIVVLSHERTKITRYVYHITNSKTKYKIRVHTLVSLIQTYAFTLHLQAMMMIAMLQW